MNIKRVKNKFDVGNYRELLDYLAEMKQEGWVLKKVSFTGLTFEEGNGEDIYYLADMYETYDETLSYNSRKEFKKEYKEQGLEFVGKIRELHIFKGSKNENSIPQPELREKVINELKRAKSQYIMLGITVVLCVLTIGITIFSIYKDELSLIPSIYELWIPPLFLYLFLGTDTILNIRKLKKTIWIYENSLECQEKLPTTPDIDSLWVRICIIGIFWFIFRRMG